MIIRVKVKANARQDQLQECDDGSWEARVAAPPVDGQANARLLRLVADHFGVPRRAVTLRSGRTARLKLVQIDLPTED